MISVNQRKASNENKIAKLFIGVGIILSVPLIAMMFTDEVNWNVFDFIVIGCLLVGAGLAYIAITSWLNEKYRAVAAVIIASLLFLVWAELAVGIIGSPFAGS